MVHNIGLWLKFVFKLVTKVFASARLVTGQIKCVLIIDEELLS